MPNPEINYPETIAEAMDDHLETTKVPVKTLELTRHQVNTLIRQGGPLKETKKDGKTVYLFRGAELIITEGDNGQEN